MAEETPSDVTRLYRCSPLFARAHGSVHKRPTW